MHTPDYTVTSGPKKAVRKNKKNYQGCKQCWIENTFYEMPFVSNIECKGKHTAPLNLIRILEHKLHELITKSVHQIHCSDKHNRCLDFVQREGFSESM